MNKTTNQQPELEQIPGGRMDEPAQEKEQGYRVNGYAQILDMLKVADAPFRESLLGRLQVRDPQLVQSLRAHLAEADL